jgi:hypothetical protein
MLEELEYDHNIYHNHEADKNLAVRFYLFPLRDDEASLREKRPIFVDTEFIEIRVRGDRNNIQQRPVREGDSQRFRAAYHEFKSGEAQALRGTPLKEWPSMTLSLIEELKYLGFHTVEQLAEANDGVMSKVPGLALYKQKAKTFLEFTKGLPAIDRIHADLEDEKLKRQAAEKNVADLVAAVQRLENQVEALKGKK